MQSSDKVFVAGHRGLVGSAILRKLTGLGYRNILTQTRSELDLRNAAAVLAYLLRERPDVVILAAAKVGGIHANNTFRAEFLTENLAIQASVILGAHSAGVRRLVFLGSSCIYPRDASQPMAETALLTGPLEFTNRPYALAKIAGLELVHSLRLRAARDYFSVMPTNLYGPEDNFDLVKAHVLPALISKFTTAVSSGADSVTLWGTGTPLREFLYSEDCADGIIFLAERLTREMLDRAPIALAGWSHVNLGSGQEVSIFDLARQIARIVNFKGRLVLDSSKPDGAQRKLLDVSYINGLGWRPSTTLEQGLRNTVAWFSANRQSQC